jgi:Mor family transcriptional regulator
LEKDNVFEELQLNIGPDAANYLVNAYAGSNLYIPKKIIIKRRHEKIRDEFIRGAGYRELALRYGYSEQYIREITKERTK